MTRILSVVWYQVLPARFGGQKGIAAFNHELASRFTLFCLCSKNNRDEHTNYTVLPELPVSRLQVINPVNWRKIHQKILDLEITHLVLEHCYYGLAGLYARKKTGVRLIVHAHNIETARFREMGKWWWPIMWLLEKKTYRQADLVLFKTKEDQSYAIRHFGLRENQCMVLPYGTERTNIPAEIDKEKAAAEIRQKHHIGPLEKILLFTGTLDYTPNANALRVLVETILPMLVKKTSQPFRLIVCGRIIYPEFKYLLSLKHENYIYAGLVDNPEKYLLAADLFLNPVVEGGGIKVKTMDALALNLTVISTSHGAIGIDPGLTGEKLKICADNDWDAFCRHITNNWDQQADTPDEFFSNYHWSAIVAPFAEKINTP